jgi:hypothetical protein
MIVWAAHLEDRIGLHSPSSDDEGNLFGLAFERVKLLHKVVTFGRSRCVTEDPIHVVPRFARPPDASHRPSSLLVPCLVSAEISSTMLTGVLSMTPHRHTLMCPHGALPEAKHRTPKRGDGQCQQQHPQQIDDQPRPDHLRHGDVATGEGHGVGRGGDR